MHLVYIFSFVIVGIKWADWKNWKQYYATILFFISCDLFHNLLTHDYPLWNYQETIFWEELLYNHTIISLLIMFIVYPITILIYLGKFPKKLWMKISWIALWVFLYGVFEFINLHYFSLITHQNGWTMPWSIAFDVVMFSTLRIHYIKPLLAWVISAACTITLILLFEIPI
ncbi:CBO0543 family protein [Ornithinibacillus contaminans]|uniref:CBO0543 family protein n=1 Tax=Ornithinibacillus contaminans TaxID=694055 RepID=UPI00064DCD7F|nr:CBO0543 family protein [Ornithinibacillus contaminans]